MQQENVSTAIKSTYNINHQYCKKIIDYNETLLATFFDKLDKTWNK